MRRELGTFLLRPDNSLVFTSAASGHLIRGSEPRNRAQQPRATHITQAAGLNGIQHRLGGTPDYEHGTSLRIVTARVGWSVGSRCSQALGVITSDREIST